MWTYTDDGMTLVDLSVMESITIGYSKGQRVITAYPYNTDEGYVIGRYDTFDEAKEALDELQDGLNAGWTD